MLRGRIPGSCRSPRSAAYHPVRMAPMWDESAVCRCRTIMLNVAPVRPTWRKGDRSHRSNTATVILKGGQLNCLSRWPNSHLTVRPPPLTQLQAKHGDGPEQVSKARNYRSKICINSRGDCTGQYLAALIEETIVRKAALHRGALLVSLSSTNFRQQAANLWDFRWRHRLWCR